MVGDGNRAYEFDADVDLGCVYADVVGEKHLEMQVSGVGGDRIDAEQVKQERERCRGKGRQ